MRLTLARARARWGTLVVVALLVAVVCATATAVLGASARAGTSDARHAVAAASADDSALVVQTRLGDDPAAQDAALAAGIDQVFGDVPLETTRSVRTEPLRVQDGSRVVVEPGLPGAETTVTAGRRPAAAGEGALQADAAEALGLEVGDDVVVTGTDGTQARITVVGAWAPTDPTDPRWAEDPLSVLGTDGDASGPLVVPTVDGSDVLGGTPFVRWVVATVPSAIGVDDLAPLASGADDLRDVLRDDDAFAVRGVTVVGGLGRTAAAADAAIAASAAAVVVPLVLLACLAAVALGQLARLLVGARRPESLLLLARGASVRRLSLHGLGEAVPVVLAGVLLGTAAGLAVVALGASPEGSSGAASPVGTAVLVGGVTLLVAVLLLAGTASGDLRGVIRGAGNGRGTRAVAGASVALVTLGAALCTWQLLRLGSVVVPAADGGLSPDPLAVLAPAALLLVAAVAVLALLGPSAQAFAALAARSRSLVPVLPARQVARRLSVVAVPVVLVSLAAGTVVLSAAVTGTTTHARADTLEVLAGADARASLGAASGADGVAVAERAEQGEASGVDGVVDAEAVLRTSGTVGDAEVAVLARGDGAAAAGQGLEGPVLPAATETLGVSADAPAGGSREGDVVVWLADSDGALVPLPVVEGTVDVPFPELRWRLVAVDLPRADAAGGTAPVVIASGTGGPAPLDLAGWARVSGLSGPGTLAPELDRWTADGARDLGTVPAAVSAPLAEALGLGTGDPVNLRLAGSDVAVVVDRVVDAVPGTSDASAVQLDLARLSDLQLRVRVAPLLADEVWTTLAEPQDATAAALAAPLSTAVLRTGSATQRAPLDVVVAAEAASRGVDPAAPVRSAFLLVTVGVLLLALVGVVAAVLVQVAERRGEVAVLRALGVGARVQGRARAAELGLVSLGAALLGGLLGAVVAWLVVPTLAVAVTPQAAGRVDVGAHLDGAVLGACAGVLVIALGLVAVLAARRVVGQARTPAYREDLR